jgi:diguanylate cyclase (GGDEF)-like protein
MTTPTLGGWLVYLMKQSDGALSLEEALHAIVDSVKEYFPCQTIAVMTMAEDTKELRINISRNISYTFVKQFHHRGPGPLAERAILQQEPLLFNDVKPGSEDYEQLKLEHEFSAAVLAPIVRDQRGIGYIFCDRADNERFTASDMLHLQVIGYLIGSLMEKFDLRRERKSLSPNDDATGALQYRTFVPALATELERARTYGYPVSLALLHVPPFRRYVGAHGIAAAHGLLAEVVRVIRKHTRDMDLLARFSADEIVLALSGEGAELALPRLLAIRSDIATTVVGQGDVQVQPVIGATCLSAAADLRRPIQDILAALGRSLVDAKALPNGSLEVHAPRWPSVLPAGRGPGPANP